MLASHVLPLEMRYLISLALHPPRVQPSAVLLAKMGSSRQLAARAHAASVFSLSERTDPPALARRSSWDAYRPGSIQLQRRGLHVSKPKEAPLPLALIGLMKSSFFISCVTTATRIVVSFLPLHIFTFLRSLRGLRRYDPLDPHHLRARPNVSPLALSIHYDSPDPTRSSSSSMDHASASPELAAELARLERWEAKGKRMFKKKLWSRRLIIWTFLGPLTIFALVVAAGLERTPLTGRWRVLLISPEEEEAIHKGLLDKGWFQAVLDILVPSSTDGTPPAPVAIVPAEDWRWDWVESTLRRLEQGAISCHSRHFDPSASSLISSARVDPACPPPPPPTHPLHPRPRASRLLHKSCLVFSSSSPQPEPSDDGRPPQLEGPPFQLLLIDSPRANAFSYGFGGGGAAGVVVNSGMLDQILGSSSSPPATAPARKSLLSMFLPASASTGRNPHLAPTEEQTLHLASILAHEISHLLLSHHLETLSHSSVLFPSAISLVADLLRTVLFPVTMIFGPFVNDALGNLSTAANTTLLSMHEACSSQQLEVEADKVGLRILAESAFDPYRAAAFWQTDHAPTPSHLGGLMAVEDGKGKGQHWAGGSHPTDEVRARAVRDELSRWRREWGARLTG